MSLNKKQGLRPKAYAFGPKKGRTYLMNIEISKETAPEKSIQNDANPTAPKKKKRKIVKKGPRTSVTYTNDELTAVDFLE